MRPGPEWFILIETLGILSFAINAMIVAKDKGLSTLGVFTCALATALGGGTLRDILLGPGAQPFFWIAYPFYAVGIFVASALYANSQAVRGLIAKRDFHVKETSEAIALASLGAIGASKSYALLSPVIGESPLELAQLVVLCAFLGAIGSAFGSILRDVLLNELPGSLKPGVWALEAVFVGCAVLAVLRIAGLDAPWAVLAGFAVTLLVRLRVVFAARAAKLASARGGSA